MAHPLVADIFQELDQEEVLLDHFRAKAEVLVVASEELIVQVDVEQFARVPCLGNRMHEIEARHVLVGDFGIDADHVRVVQCGDEAEH